MSTKSTNPFTSDTSSPEVPKEREVALVIRDHLMHLDFPSPTLHCQTSARPNVLWSKSAIESHLSSVLEREEVFR